MTDNDIIKALGCCDSYFDCDGCPCQDVCGGLGDLSVNTLDLINRQKAEIKSLTEKLEALGDPLQDAHYKIAEQQAEIARLKEFIEKDQGLILHLTNVSKDEYDNKIKAEAINEFAEKLPELIPNFNGETTMETVERAIKHLVQEMAGDIPKIEHNSLCETDTYEVGE